MAPRPLPTHTYPMILSQLGCLQGGGGNDGWQCSPWQPCHNLTPPQYVYKERVWQNGSYSWEARLERIANETIQRNRRWPTDRAGGPRHWGASWRVIENKEKHDTRLTAFNYFNTSIWEEVGKRQAWSAQGSYSVSTLFFWWGKRAAIPSALVIDSMTVFS